MFYAKLFISGLIGIVVVVTPFFLLKKKSSTSLLWALGVISFLLGSALYWQFHGMTVWTAHVPK
jgi:hypothetical protein